MSLPQKRKSGRRQRTRGIDPTGEQRMKLVYKFAKHVIQHFQNSKAAYVQPFLTPVDQEADDAPAYYTIIKRPMDLFTMLLELESGKYHNILDVGRSFNRMFDNCFKYNPSDNEVYRKGENFRKAWWKMWSGRDDWIRAQAAASDRFSDTDDEDDSNEECLHEISDDDENNDIDESTEDAPEDENTSDDDPPIRRRNYVLQKTDSEEDVPLEAHERKGKARKKDGSKSYSGLVNTASDLNTNYKRSSDTTSTTETSTSSPPQQQALVNEELTEEQTIISTQDHELSAEQGPAKRPRLEPSTEPPSESPPQTPTQQERIQDPADKQRHQPTTQTESPVDPYQAFLSNMVTEQIARLSSRIDTNATGEFDQYLFIWNLLCSNEQRLVLERVWKAEAMESVGRMQSSGITSLVVEEQVKSAFRAVILKQWERVKEGLDRDAAGLSRSFDRHDGDTGHA